ncbi:hypothetical protein [Micromonospora sp. NPDC049204]|uniref:hypothetical protein n=1 Tax=unclassified Micromonospora TaxID=2617518 RepID=UPI0033F498B7
MTSTLHVRVGRQLWTTQFYSTSLVDFQGDPLAVTTKADLDDVEKFMVVISRATGKTARFIPESLDPQKTRSYLEVGP